MITAQHTPPGAQPRPDASAPAGSAGMDDDAARDSLHVLPISILPVRTAALRRDRLIKNHRLETMVELFRDAAAGSGQVEPAALPALFADRSEELAADVQMFHRLSEAPSFDVYTLRVELRRLEIEVDRQESLQLSARKRAELTEQMAKFTRPLIRHIYGVEQNEVTDVSDILSMVRRPNREEALANLHHMADRLHVQLHEIPRFLEDYGDIFLSLAYFRKILDKVVPEVHWFLSWMKEAMETRQVRDDRPLLRSLETTAHQLSDISGSITGRFESFDRKTQDFWAEITAERFHEVRDLIVSHHTTIGGVLCGLVLKMDLFAERFGGKPSVGPNRRVDFVRSEIEPGLGWMNELERSAAARI